MTDKRRIRRGIGWLQRVHTWQLVLLLVLVGLLAATFLRLNNIGMIERRTAVLNADKAGDQEVTRARLFDLQRYSASHMNAASGTIYLESQYQRDIEKAVAAAANSGQAENVNVLADRACKERFSGYSQAYAQCFYDEMAKFPANDEAPDKASLPSASLYRHDFASPAWSPDFAGFALVLGGFIVLLIVTRLLGLVILRALLHRNYSSV